MKVYGEIINTAPIEELYDNLQQRIDKAIEYIEKSDDNENSYGDYDIEYHFKKELLDILKGSDEE